jgi:hypothetical protein
LGVPGEKRERRGSGSPCHVGCERFDQDVVGEEVREHTEVKAIDVELVACRDESH